MIGVVIVTHNSESVIQDCVNRILKQSGSFPVNIIIVDSGSDNTEYLDKFVSDSVTVIYEKNVGYAEGNNIGIKKIIDSTEFVFIMNPDAYIEEDFISDTINLLNRKEYENVGILGPKLLRYDLEKMSPTDEIDSSGVFQTWYGRWYDRGWGSPDDGQYDTLCDGESVPALTGALLICRSSVLKKITGRDAEVFNSSFFMYKEDIDLCLRARDFGVDVKYTSELSAYHCRGYWKRKDMAKWARIISAKNEIVVNKKLGFIKLMYSRLKYILALAGF
ncbi:glycosyltransferase family 2 protein [bacterium]|nr:glycosyltransferase family 2 protein [bacterium]